ncbi:hypothetical protein CCU68_08420, partial [Pseudomonas gingeri NCPPB 3146 = LMG 5327]
NGLSAARPCLQGAFAAYPCRFATAVFHDPLHAARLWIVRAYRDLPKLTSRPTTGSALQSQGF